MVDVFWASVDAPSPQGISVYQTGSTPMEVTPTHGDPSFLSLWPFYEVNRRVMIAYAPRKSGATWKPYNHVTPGFPHVEDIMLTRREFTEVVSCALCAITAELMATEAAAQGTPATTPGVTRKILSQIDGPTPGYVTILAEATIEAGVSVARLTHPGIESAWVLEGGLEVPVQGRPTVTVKAGDAFQIPPDTPHAGGKPLEAKARLIITYIVQKDKPLASPV